MNDGLQEQDGPGTTGPQQEDGAEVRPNTATKETMPPWTDVLGPAAQEQASSADHPEDLSPAPPVAHNPGPLDLLRDMMFIIVVALFVLTFLAQPYRIPSGSMKNTLLVGDFLMVNKMVYATPGPWRFLLPYREVQRGDIVVFHYPLAPSVHVVKRVIGLPHDTVRLQDGKVWVNGRPLEEPYAIHDGGDPGSFRDNFPSRAYTDPGINTRWWGEMQQDTQDGALVVPPGQYFVLGDNRNDSLDSRYWGFVPRQNIVGGPFLIYFSLIGPASSETTGAQEGLTGRKQDWRARLAGIARWDRMFHVIH